MTTIKRIREYLTATPFRPIRVHLTTRIEPLTKPKAKK